MEAINLEEEKTIENIKLDLMDWKSAEKVCEDSIRELKMTLRLHELTRVEAKKMIRSFDGKTSEEERAETKKKIDGSLKNTT